MIAADHSRARAWETERSLRAFLPRKVVSTECIETLYLLGMRTVLSRSLVAFGVVVVAYGCNRVGSPGIDVEDGGADGGVSLDGGDTQDGAVDASVSDANGGTDAAPNPPSTACPGTKPSASTPGPAPSSVAGLTVPSGFVLERIASVPAAREIAALPNGDLLVGTQGSNVYLVPDAEAAGAVGTPKIFATIDDAPAQGIAFDKTTCTIFVGTQHGVYSIPYGDGQNAAPNVTKIASVRTGAVTPNSDGDVHTSTSVGVANGQLYAAVGSSCNACAEVDGTRATIQQMNLDGSHMTTKATRIRNAIALAANPDTGTLWAGGAGQDNLPKGHPYEYFDAVTLHGGVADYGWPACEENRTAYVNGADCSSVVVPRVELPAYSTLIGAAYYAPSQSGAHAFPSGSRGFFVTAHGSWHKTGNVFSAKPTIVLVPMNGDAPKTAVDWSDPTKQWTEFVGGFEPGGTTRIARPTGIAVGASGSLFFADDQNGAVYRVRPQ